jgi:hypothetical protein
MYRLEKYEKIRTRLMELVEKTRFKLEHDIKNILFLANTKDHELCVFKIIELFNQRSDVNFIFGVTSVQEHEQLQDSKVFIKEFTTFYEKTKAKMEEIDREDFSVILLEGSSLSPYEKLKKLLEKVKIDLIIIPYPFLNFNQEYEALDEVIHQLIKEIVLELNVSLLLFQSCEIKPEFSNIDLVFRGVTIRRDILAWILTFLATEAEISTFKTGKINQKDYDRLLEILEVLNEKLTNQNIPVHFNNQLEDLDLESYCQIMPDGGKLVIYQDITTSEDARYVYETLCVHSNSTLILPHDKN